MRPFQYNFHNTEAGLIVLFSGSITENAKLPDFSAIATNQVVFDMENVDFINSLGIRKWMKWHNQLPEKTYTFINIPAIIIDKMRIIQDFFPKGALIKSFFVPLYCENCDLEREILYSEGTHYQVDQGFLQTQQHYCNQCKSPLELSLNEVNYTRIFELLHSTADKN